MGLSHDTIKLERQFDASPEAVFAAYKDPKAREIWCVPSPSSSFKVINSQVMTGGTEIAKCGPKPETIKPNWDGSDLPWEMRLDYHFVDAPNLIVFTERLFEGDQLLTIALVSFDLKSHAGGTKLTLTDQIASLVGPQLVSEHREGYEFALNKLSLYLDRA